MTARMILFPSVTAALLCLPAHMAIADCEALRNVVAERAEALHVARKAIKEIKQLIRDSVDEVESADLEAELVLYRTHHKAIVSKIEDAGRRLSEECGEDG